MKPIALLLASVLISTAAFAQEWRLYTGSDEITAFAMDHNTLWVVSGSGLSKIDVNTGERTTWNTLNSDMPDYVYRTIAIDSQGTVWLGAYFNNRLTTFDGTNWTTYTEINGVAIRDIYRIQVTPDGKVWIAVIAPPAALYFYEGGIFQSVEPPAPWIYSGAGFQNSSVDMQSHLWMTLSDSGHHEEILGEYTGTEWILHDLSQVSGGDGGRTIADKHGNIYMLIGRLALPNFLKYDGLEWQTIDLPANANDFNNAERPLYIDRQDNVWLGLGNNTFLVYDGNTWSTVDLNTYGLTDGYPDGLCIDDNDKKWFVYTHRRGPQQVITTTRLYSADGLNTSLIDLSNSDIASNNVGTVFIDKQNRKWIGSVEGLMEYDGALWTTLGEPGTVYLSNAVGAMGTGGVWLESSTSSLSNFDGANFNNIVVVDPQGEYFTYSPRMAVDSADVVYAAFYRKQILVYDHGNISYLDSLPFTLYGNPAPQDPILDVDLDASGRLYALGHSLHRWEDDQSWTEIPLPEGEIVNDFKIAPNGDLWISHGLIWPGKGFDYSVYQGTSWTRFMTPFNDQSFPEWDSKGTLWLFSEKGLCKLENGEWFCYDETNSPVTGGRITSFTIDASDNFWISRERGGLLLFNEDKIRDIDAQPVSTSGLQKTDLRMNVYPNPADSEIRINVAGEEQAVYDYTLVDVFGRVVIAGKVRSGEVETVSIEGLTSGVYYLIVEGKGERRVKVVVKG